MAEREDEGPISALAPGGVRATSTVAVTVAWRQRRALFVVVALVLAPALAAEILAGVVGSGDRAAIVNDRLIPHDSDSGLGFLASPVMVFLAWCVAVGAAVTVVGAGLLAAEPPAPGALRMAARALPTTVLLPPVMAFGFVWTLISGPALWVILVGAGALLVASAVAGEDSWLFAAVAVPVVIFGIVAPLAGALARWALVVPAAVIGGLRGRAAFARVRELTRAAEPSGRETAPARARLLPIPGLLMLAGVVLWIGVTVDRPAGAWSGALLHAALLALVMLQAVTLGLLFLRRRADGDEAAAVDLDAVRDRLPAPAGRSRWGWFGVAVAVLLLPTLVAEGAVAVNPYDVPRWRLHESNLDGGVRAAEWPAGQHPIVVTDAHVVDCLDEGCRRQARWGSTLVPISTVTVGSDGTVVMARVSRPGGRRDLVRVERCTRAGDCTRSEFTWPADPAGHQPIVATAADRSGALLLAAARRVSGQRVEVTLTSCAEWTCAQPRTTVLGTIAEPSPSGGTVGTVGTSTEPGPAGDTRPRTPYGRGPLAVRARPDGGHEVVYRGHHGAAAVPVICSPGCAPAERVADDALAVSADGSYALLAEVGPESDETFGALGAAVPPRVEFVVARCAQPGCDTIDRRWRLNGVTTRRTDIVGLLVVTADRRALVVEAIDRLSIATATLPAA